MKDLLTPHIEYGLHEYGAFEFSKEDALTLTTFSFNGTSHSSVPSNYYSYGLTEVDGKTEVSTPAGSLHNSTYTGEGDSYANARSHTVKELLVQLQGGSYITFAAGGSVFTLSGNASTKGVANYISNATLLGEAVSHTRIKVVKVQVGDTSIKTGTSVSPVGFTVRFIGSDPEIVGTTTLDMQRGYVALTSFLEKGVSALYVDTGNLFMTQFPEAYDVAFRPAEIRSSFRPEEVRGVIRPFEDRDNELPVKAPTVRWKQ